MTIEYYDDIIQGSDEWLALRRGILTASEMKLIVTPTFKTADNEKTRVHLYELLSQRISGYVEPHYVSDDMMRGHEEEVLARIKYTENFAPVQDVGFVTNDRVGASRWDIHLTVWLMKMVRLNANPAGRNIRLKPFCLTKCRTTICYKSKPAYL